MSSRESVREISADIPAARIMADLRPLPDGFSPTSFLTPPRGGFYCPYCSTFRSLHERKIRHHSVKVQATTINTLIGRDVPPAAKGDRASITMFALVESMAASSNTVHSWDHAHDDVFKMAL
jgi:hypothetical protein